jgi:hypothetical protein
VTTEDVKPVPFTEVRPLLDKLFAQHGHLVDEAMTTATDGAPRVFSQTFNYNEKDFSLKGIYSTETWPIWEKKFGKPLPPRIMLEFKITYNRGSLVAKANGACPVPRWVVDRIRSRLVLETLADL